MTRFIKNITLILLPVLLMAAFNIYKDRSHVIDSKRFLNEAIEALKNNKNVAGLEDYDERYLASCLTKNTFDIVIFGSSRTAEIGSTMLGDRKVLNLSVSGSTWQDYLGLYNLLAIDNKDIKDEKTFIICVDPWLFNAKNGEVRWETLSESTKKQANLFGINGMLKGHTEAKWMAQAREIFNPAYFYENLKGSASTYSITKDTIGNMKIVFPDGSIRYDKFKENRDSTQTKVRANEFAKRKELFHLGGFKAIDSSSRKAVFELIMSCKKQGRVFVMLMPYHPIVWKRIKTDKDYAMVQECEDMVWNFCSENNLPLIGNYNPDKSGFRENDFFDGMHLNRKAIAVFCQKIKL